MTKTANFCRVRPANCCSGATTDRRCRCRWTFLTLAFYALKMRRLRTSFDPCIVVFFSSTVAYVHCWCRLTMNLMMTRARNLVASETRHCSSYCGRFSGILHSRPWFTLLWASSRFFLSCESKLSMDKVFNDIFTREFLFSPLCLAIEIYLVRKSLFLPFRELNELIWMK